MITPTMIFLIYIVIGMLLTMPFMKWLDSSVKKAVEEDGPEGRRLGRQYEAYRSQKHFGVAMLVLIGFFWMPFACYAVYYYYKKEDDECSD